MLWIKFRFAKYPTNVQIFYYQKPYFHFRNNKLQLSIDLSKYNFGRMFFFSQRAKMKSAEIKSSTHACVYKLHQLCATFMRRRIHYSPFKSVDIKVYEMHWNIGVSDSENAAWGANFLRAIFFILDWKFVEQL